MTKEALKDYLISLTLDKKLQDLLFELIDDAKEVNNELLELVSNTLEQQANFYQNLADLKKDEAAIYEDFENDTVKLENEYKDKSQQIIADAQEELANEINQEVDKLRTSVTAQDIDTTRQEIKTAGVQQNNNTVNTEEPTQQSSNTSPVPSSPTTSTQ